MVFGLSPAAILVEFTSRPFIQRSLATPRSPQSVLSFWMGFDIMSENAKDTLNSGSYVKEMQPLWFGGGPDYDKLCQKFIPTVRDGGKGLLQTDNEYNWDNVDGKLAKLILFDQISRNAFRGTDEAFEYDTLSLEIARELAAKSLSDEPSFFASYNFFLVVALMHSENLEDHQLGAQCIDKAKLACSGIQWESTREFLLEHTEVIDLFGRYPHRNKKKGRESTKEEVDWLKSENVPGWAKSQG